eukprot:5512077-Pleurochrysis_carterae.AAC.1
MVEALSECFGNSTGQVSSSAFSRSSDTLKSKMPYNILSKSAFKHVAHVSVQQIKGKYVGT